MPEGPEIEIICRGLKKSTLKKQIEQVIVRNNKLRYLIADSLGEKLQNQQINEVCRKGRYIVISLNNEEKLLIHLGMTGKLVYSDFYKEPEKHDHVVFAFSGGGYLYYHDIRRFGSIEWLMAENLANHRSLRLIGPDPMKDELNKEYLEEKFKKINKPIKSVIMDNKILTSIGNIYASESLYMASIHPEKPAFSLDSEDIDKLLLSMKQVTEEALAKNGSSFSDYRDSEGNKGEFQKFFKVYKRENLPCFKCGASIEKIKIAGRASFFCPICQQT